MIVELKLEKNQAVMTEVKRQKKKLGLLTLVLQSQLFYF